MFALTCKLPLLFRVLLTRQPRGKHTAAGLLQPHCADRSDRLDGPFIDFSLIVRVDNKRLHMFSESMQMICRLVGGGGSVEDTKRLPTTLFIQ